MRWIGAAPDQPIQSPWQEMAGLQLTLLKA
jgi:hypothetical protein